MQFAWIQFPAKSNLDFKVLDVLPLIFYTPLFMSNSYIEYWSSLTMQRKDL